MTIPAPPTTRRSASSRMKIPTPISNRRNALDEPVHGVESEREAADGRTEHDVAARVREKRLQIFRAQYEEGEDDHERHRAQDVGGGAHLGRGGLCLEPHGAALAHHVREELERLREVA